MRELARERAKDGDVDFINHLPRIINYAENDEETATKALLADLTQHEDRNARWTPTPSSTANTPQTATTAAPAAIPACAAQPAPAKKHRPHVPSITDRAIAVRIQGASRNSGPCAVIALEIGWQNLNNTVKFGILVELNLLKTVEDMTVEAWVAVTERVAAKSGDIPVSGASC